MIKEFQRFKIIDERGKNTFTIDVNWNPKDEATNECKILKVKFPNGDEAYVRKELLNSFLFTIGAPEEQRKMIPQKLSKTKWYETVWKIKATKDVKKGEDIVFAGKISLPMTDEEFISSRKAAEKTTKSGIVIPTK